MTVRRFDAVCTMISKYKQKRVITLGVCLTLLIVGSVVFAIRSSAQEASNPPDTSAKAQYDQLNQQIEEKKLQLQDLNNKINQYQDSIKVKQQEALSLQGEIALIDDQVSQTNTDIDRIKVELERTDLEIKQLALQVEQKKQQVTVLNERLGDYIRLLNQYDGESGLRILLSEGSISDFFDRVQYSEDVQQKIKDNLVDVRKGKEALQEEQSAQEAKKGELASLNDHLTQSIQNLKDQQSYKTDLLNKTKDNQSVFEDLLTQAQVEQKQVDAEISSTEERARQKLAQEGSKLLDSVAALSWPVSPRNGISAYFHDPTYIFRRYFEHPAIDIPTPQGTPILAPADGYVSRAKNAGMGYSFIMIIHNNQISTVYGHVSKIEVTEDQYVRRGDEIGLSGGMPGTPGAGQMTTGSHLHFEVRLNGLPVNPLDYLPKI